MHLVMVVIQLIMLGMLFSSINKLPYVLGGFYLLGVISSVFVIDASFLTIAGITIGAADILTLIMILHLMRKPYIQKNPVNILLLLYILILLFSFMSGLIDRNISVIIANIRKYFEYTLPWLVMLNLTEDLRIEREKLKRYFSCIITLSEVNCIVGFMMFAAGRSATLRVIGSDSTMILACYFLYRVYDEIYTSRRAFISVRSIILLVVIIVLQHNSVWVATVIGLGIVIIYTMMKRGISSVPGMICLILILCAGYTYVMEYSDSAIAEYMKFSISKFDDMNSGTIGHRKERWSTMLETLSGYEHLIGQSFSVATVAGDGTTFSAHNAYVATIMHSGLLGVICFVGALLATLIRCIQEKNILFFSIIASISIYWYAYEPNINFGVLLGILYVCADSEILDTIFYRNE